MKSVRRFTSALVLMGGVTLAAFLYLPPPERALAQSASEVVAVDAGAALTQADASPVQVGTAPDSSKAAAPAVGNISPGGGNDLPAIDTAQAVGIAEQLFQAVHTGNWWLAAGLLVTLLVLGAHVFAAKVPGKASAFLTSYGGAFILTTLLSAGGAIIHAASVGHPVNVELFETVAKVFITAGISYLTARLQLPMPPQNAGASSASPANAGFVRLAMLLALVVGSLLALPLAARADTAAAAPAVAAPAPAAPTSSAVPTLSQRLGLAFTHGLSAPAIDIGNGMETDADGHKVVKSQVTFLKSGLGYSFGVGLFPTKEGAHLLNISVPVYANVTTTPGVSGVQFTMTTGLMVGVLDGLIGLGYGYDLFHAVGGPDSAGLLLGQMNPTCGHWLVTIGVPVSGLSAVSSVLGISGG